MSPAGRPPIDGETKGVRLQVLVSPSERARLDAAAAKAGKPTSTWARDELLRLADEAAAAKPAKRRRTSR
jgi:hypothetical protein